MVGKHIRLLIVIWTGVALVLGCSKKTSSGLNEGLDFYRQNRLKEARVAFERAIKEDKTNPDVYAWLGETYRRLDLKEDAILMAKKALELDSCHSFALTIIGFAYNPMYGLWKDAHSDSAWHYLQEAVECSPSDGNAWIGIWPESIRRGDKDRQSQALQSLLESEFFTPAVLAYNRWMLKYVPENAILLTNGDIDTYPAVALQQVENLRRDIVVVNYSLLNTTWYARFLRDQYKIGLPFTDAELDDLKAFKDNEGRLLTPACQIMKGWLEMRRTGSLKRPIAISATVGDLSFADDTQNHLRVAGPFSLWLPDPPDTPDDTSTMRQSLQCAKDYDFSGSFVSLQDRSSIRICSSDRIVTNITALALKYCQALLESKRTPEAKDVLTWAEKFENNTKAGPVLSGEIRKLKGQIEQASK